MVVEVVTNGLGAHRKIREKSLIGISADLKGRGSNTISGSPQPTSGAGLMEKNWARFGNYFQTRCPFCLVRSVTPRVLIGTFQGAILATLCIAGKAEM